MEITFRFDENNRAVTINVPSGGGFTVNFNHVARLEPPSGGRSNDNGSHVQAPGGFTINVNYIGLPLPSANGGLNVNRTRVHPENPNLSDPSLKMANPRVFFDMTVGGKPAGRIVMELFADTTPWTAENFRALCTGEKGIGKFGKPLHYKGTIFHKVFPNYTLCGGDIISGKGETGGECIYGSRFFSDESFSKTHNGPGVLTMWNCRPNTNGSQFMICLRKIVDFDGECVVFGQVVEGLDVIQYIEKEVGQTDNLSGVPTKLVVIADCGQIS
ncbi:Cyclophilin-type peptidyl-prolyl cis-trans isomerase domain-containing protein [Hirschfeldia incana]|nr:Cyclophilin-type peptidyl-prolyl cis-trans isomerase domain-containing protein [Hirschfeldia incana]